MMVPTFRDLAVFFDSSEKGLAVLGHAARLAGQHDAHLIGVTSAPRDQAHAAEGYSKGAAMADVILARSAFEATYSLHAGRAVATQAEANKVTSELRFITYSETREEATLHTLYTDLVVVGHPKAFGAPMTWNSDRVVSLNSTPLLLLPDHYEGVSLGARVLVAWNGSRAARRSIADAMPILAHADQVELLIVDPKPNKFSLEEEPGADVATYLGRHGAAVEVNRISADGSAVVDVIMNRAVEGKFDLIVLGAYSRSRMSEILFGGTTRSFLESVPLPLFLSH
ncbi:universal stress protein [Stenotrophomonas sp. S39]|uniref:universal stress protein n=1 Tax=Stenotrophomonas sp. S39 TaxID=2767451 RepID=UPI00190B251B|nr:universal stress protein [Stenotrophomonas sp. S39]MBK0052722.1 universal stress protein [Stenotrophomonas sp. S39]